MNKSHSFVRVVAGPIVAAAILGGAALGFAAGADASTATPEQMKQEQAAEMHARETRQSGRTPTPPARRVVPKVATAPGAQPARKG